MSFNTHFGILSKYHVYHTVIIGLMSEYHELIKLFDILDAEPRDWTSCRTKHVAALSISGWPMMADGV